MKKALNDVAKKAKRHATDKPTKADAVVVAFGKICTILKPFTPEQQERIMRAVTALVES